MAFVLLDTDILMNLLRGVEKAKLYVQNAVPDNIIGCSTLTVAEIYAAMRTHEKEKTDLLLDGLEIIEVTRVIAEKAGLYRAANKSHVLELDDSIVAATAFEMKATLATGNGKHYPMDDIRKEIFDFKD
jgi:predicted nucleic acid-binding protein